MSKKEKIIIGLIILALLYLTATGIFCKPKGILRVATGYYDNRGKPIYVIEIYTGLDGGKGSGDWCACYWNRFDFHDYYTREEAEKVMKERGYRR